MSVFPEGSEVFRRIPARFWLTVGCGFAYYRWFVRDFAKLAAPLHCLVAEVARDKRQKNCDLRCEVWSADLRKKFFGVKNAVSQRTRFGLCNFFSAFFI